MHYEMRRKDRELPLEQAKQLLAQGKYGVLSTVDADGTPYGVPLSYALEKDTLYFHGSSAAGHKSDNIRNGCKACFTVVGNTRVLPEKFSTEYESVIVFGTIAQAPDKATALAALCRKYSPDFTVQGAQYAEAAAQKTDVYALQIESISGKARRT